ncbi:hypothetical protein H8959_021867 [Pygathrix nigripes]
MLAKARRLDSMPFSGLDLHGQTRSSGIPGSLSEGCPENTSVCQRVLQVQSSLQGP